MALSLAKFEWKTSGQIDRVEDLFDDELHFVHITGHVSSKSEWIDELRSGRFAYEHIEPKDASVTVDHSKVTLTGRAIFTVRMGRHSGQFKLAFTETYVRQRQGWKLVELLTSTY
ncbi:MAG: nuclear transport factor 2 family protein [Rhizobium sp.]|nr:nuclear transport factor 2 family protein [Rhizobium sp.]